MGGAAIIAIIPIIANEVKQLDEISNIKRGIFQGDSLSPLLFVICLIPMSLILRKMKAGYSLGMNQPNLNHVLYMDDLKLFGQSERDVNHL